jgi:c-di-AMP phosphodiesterase-like protein
VQVSARSDGSINVQLILEQVGGGGHFDAAGASFEESTLEDAEQQLKAAIDNYLDNLEAEKNNE